MASYTHRFRYKQDDRSQHLVILFLFLFPFPFPLLLLFPFPLSLLFSFVILFPFLLLIPIRLALPAGQQVVVLALIGARWHHPATHSTARLGRGSWQTFIYRANQLSLRRVCAPASPPRHSLFPPCPSTPLNHCARCHVEPRRALTESRTENHFTCCRHCRPVPVPICGSQRTAAKRPQIGSHHLVTRNCQRVQATGNWDLAPGTRHAS